MEPCPSEAFADDLDDVGEGAEIQRQVASESAGVPPAPELPPPDLCNFGERAPLPEPAPFPVVLGPVPPAGLLDFGERAPLPTKPFPVPLWPAPARRWQARPPHPHRVRSRGVARRPAVRRRRVPARGDPSSSDDDVGRTAARSGVAA